MRRTVVLVVATLLLAASLPAAADVLCAKGRIPVREYLEKQGRFAHLVDEDVDYIQGMVDTMWNEWDIPGVAPFKAGLSVAG